MEKDYVWTFLNLLNLILTAFYDFDDISLGNFAIIPSL